MTNVEIVESRGAHGWWVRVIAPDEAEQALSVYAGGTGGPTPVLVSQSATDAEPHEWRPVQ